MLLHLLADDQPLLARVDPRTRARAGQEIELMMDIDRIHVFDADTQESLAKIELPEELKERPADD